MIAKVTHSDKNAAALNADNCVVIGMDAIKKKCSPPPYKRFTLTNYNVHCSVDVLFNGGIDNGNTLLGSGDRFLLPAGSKISVYPSDEILFEYVAIKNTHATENIAIGDLEWTIKNF